MRTYKVCEELKRNTKTENKTEEGMGGVPPPKMDQSHGSITMATSGPKNLGKHHGCCFTLFEYGKHIEALREYLNEEADYGVFGYEVCPKSGRPHLQGYVHWKNHRSIGAFSKKFGNCHVEGARGTAKENRDYCLKQRPGDKPNEQWEEFGEMPVQGKRTDWEKALKELKEGKDVTDVLEDQPQLIPTQRALREFKSMLLKPLHREINVIVIYGQAGVGKTRYAYDKHPDLYTKPVGQWWDGYTGQKAILLDDFYGWIEYHDLLRVLDRYPYNAPVKGGFVYAQWDTIYITSNKPPAQWYKHGLSPALERRLNKVIYMYRGENGEACYEAQGRAEATDEST